MKKTTRIRGNEAYLSRKSSRLTCSDSEELKLNACPRPVAGAPALFKLG